MKREKVMLIRVKPETHKDLKIFLAESGSRSFDDMFSRELLPMLRNRKRRYDNDPRW